MSQTDRASGLIANAGMKLPCVVASTADLTLEGEQTIDDVAVVTGDRILAKDQSDTTENGIWVVDTGEWTRAKDCDGAHDLVKGSLVYVHSGTAGSGLWHCTSSDDITIGTDAIAWSAV